MTVRRNGVTRDGLVTTDGVWFGPSRRLEVKVAGRVRDLTAVLVDPGSEPQLVPVLAAGQPEIISREAWGADETLRTGKPTITPLLKAAVISRTGTSDAYRPEQAASIVRALYLYHTRGNGWDDIGANFLVDRFGRVYEGRAGGITRNVVGQHTPGFDVGTVGVAIIGSYRGAAPAASVRGALERLLAWRLDLAHLRGDEQARLTSSGNDLHAAGKAVDVPVIAPRSGLDGARSPGPNVVAILPALRERVARRQGLQILDPVLDPPTLTRATGGDFVPTRIRARLSSASAWRAAVVTEAGVVLGELRGEGTTVEFVWPGPAVTAPTPPAASLRWVIEAGSARPVNGLFDGSGSTIAPPPDGNGPGGPAGDAMRDLRVDPAAFTPNGDGQDEVATVSWQLVRQSVVRVTIIDLAGAEVAVLDPGTAREPGPFSLSWDGMANGVPVTSGHYRARLAIQPAGDRLVTADVPLDVRRGATGLTVDPVLSPNGDGRLEVSHIALTRLEPGDTVIRVLAGKKTHRVVATIANIFHLAGPASTTWDGAGLPDGNYRVQVVVPTAGGSHSLVAPFRIDRAAPKVRVAGVIRGKKRVRLDLNVNEAGRLVVFGPGRSLLRVDVRPGPNVLRIPSAAVGRARALIIVSRDAAENQTRAAVVRLRR